EAASIFAKIARENRKLEKSKYPDNITKLSQTMFSIIKNENEKENLQLEIENLSPLFKGLGLWIKAHNEKDQGKKEEFLKKARENKNIFIWLK
ncbi:MAG TPA: hypothetical protein P5105_05525, partial [Victivallales bacterium]|nr:hypothetical protein [Victivallales bacterium]